MRKSGKRQRDYVPLDPERLGSLARTESGPGGDFTVRRGTRGTKTYTCPGCHGVIAPGTSHVVAWSNDALFGAEAALAERRHWHTGCWDAARRRGY